MEKFYPTGPSCITQIAEKRAGMKAASVVLLKRMFILLLTVGAGFFSGATEVKTGSQAPCREIILIAANVPDPTALIAGLPGYAEVYQLEKARSAVDQITEIIGSYRQLAAVHLITHGSPGSLDLGNEWLNSQNLPHYAASLRQWRNSLEPGGDLLLYGCRVASGEKGKVFLAHIRKLTGLDIAASTDLTASGHRGNWTLEKHTGRIEARSITSAGYRGTLQSLPGNGLYTFAGAVKINDGTYRTADGFFLLSGSNGSSDPTAPDKISADKYGAFLDDGALNTSGTSYLEVKVRAGGSFKISGSVIGEYEQKGSAVTNDFFYVYAVGLVNGVEVARTPVYNGIGAYVTDYAVDFSDFAEKAVDAFRVYYSWNTGTRQYDFNLQDITIADASFTSLPALSTALVSNVTAATATLGGEITSDGGAAVTERGIVWATTANPTTADYKVQMGAGTGSFSQTVTDLPANSTLYARAYAINAAGTAYGSEIAFSTGSSLPVTWLGFTAGTVGAEVGLQWSTATELNTLNYVVQHSTDTRQWTSLGTVAAAGNSSTTQSYRFIHPYPATGANYYRLAQHDRDGRTTYSRVARVIFSPAESIFSVYPNPVVNGTVQVNLQRPEIIRIYNSTGALMMHKSLPAGVQRLNLQHLSKGVYHLKAADQTTSLIIR